MATYIELYNLSGNANLVQKVCAAVAIAAEDIRTEDESTVNHEARLQWARSALQNVDGMARQMMWVLMAQNSNATAVQIENATDAAIQNAVNNAIALFL